MGSGRRTFALVVMVGSFVVAAAIAAGVVLAAGVVTPEPVPAHARAATATPSPARVASELSGVTNAHAAATGSAGTISRASCVEGTPGSYVCSFVRNVRAGAECAVAMLRWTPGGTSTYTVRVAGSVPLPPSLCGPVKTVLHFLGTA